MKRAAIVATLLTVTLGGSAGQAAIRTTAAVLPPVDAVNALLGTAWGPIAKQRADDAVKSLEAALDDKKIAGDSGHKNGFKWSFSLKLEHPKVRIDAAAAPSFRAASRDGFTLELPRGPGFDISIAAAVDGHASVKAGNQTLFSWSPSLHFGLKIDDLKIVAETKLESSRPNRPTVVSSKVTPSVTLRGDGFLPVSLPIAFTAETEGELVVLRGHMTAVKLKEELSGLDAKLTADLAISLLPRGLLDAVAGESNLGLDVDDIPIKGDLRTVKVELDGTLKAGLKKVGSISVPFKGIEVAIPFPSGASIDDMLKPLSGEPRRWGDAKRAPYGPVPATSTLATPVTEIETGTLRHMPHGAVLSLDFADSSGRGPSYTYGRDEDSAIWTGHYLAAEAFRYSATKSPDALANVKTALEGVRRLFWVTEDAAVTIEAGKTKRVPVTLGTGILARTAKPDTDPIQFTRRSDATESGPLERRPCHYMRPEGGWRAGGRIYPFLRAIPAGTRGVPEPIGPVWYGWGCGDNHAVTRDQYVGTMLGLGLAYELVPDTVVRGAAGTLIANALGFLLRNDWNIRLPPGNRIASTGTFLGDYPKQLAFLRIGKTAGVAEAAAKYEELQRAAELAWLPVWGGAFEPFSQYFKFNLSHASFLSALALESNPEQRERWYSSYLLLWGPVAHHKNAYFDLVRVLAEPTATRRTDVLRAPASATNPTVPMGDEVKIVLGEWIRRWSLVKGTWGPLNKVGDASHQLRLWPNDVGRYTTLDGTTYCLGQYALPVDGRRGKNADFIWEFPPFRLSVGEAACNATPLPDVNQIAQPSSREGPGVDYLLAYWMAVSLGVLPKP